MSESPRKWLNLFSPWQVLVLLIVVFCCAPHLAMAKQAMLKKIDIQQDPLTVEFFVTQKIPVKLIQVEKKALLIALKNVKLAKGFQITGKKKPAIRQVALEHLQGDVIGVMLTHAHPYGKIQSKFTASDSSFMITFEEKTPGNDPIPPPGDLAEKDSPKPVKNLKKETQNKDSQALPAREASKSIGKKEPQKPFALPSIYVPAKREQSEYQGDISDLIHIVDRFPCDSEQVLTSLRLLKKQAYTEAFEGLSQYISQESIDCLEPAYFLKAYAAYKKAKKDDFAQLIKAERYFQDALISFPKSSLCPYGYSAIGLIQKKMNNLSAAEGYFNLVKQDYLDYSGLAEILYHLADIYGQKGYPDKALRYYRQVFQDGNQNVYTLDAGIGYGKMLFDNKKYLDSLTVLNYVVALNPKKIYTSPDVLLIIGNADFEVGQSKMARQTLTRALNLFPEIEGRDVILSKIGDTYGMENAHEKAVKVYELVREKFPGSQGYIASSMGIARYLKNDQEKIDMYQMIKNKFPEDKFARISMMRLAEIYQTRGEYHNCIKEIETLLSKHPRGLQYEAVKLMQSAYEALFEKQLKSDDYTGVLNTYEFEHEKIDRMDSRKIDLNVGLAYLQAKLYEQSFNHLINAYKQYKRSSRSPELILGLGIAMDESGRDDDALKLFDAYSKRFPKDDRQVEALCRAGSIYLAKKNYAVSSEKYHKASKISKNPLEKGRILLLQSTVYEQSGEMKAAADFCEQAVKEIALASGENYDVLTHAYKELGRTYISLKDYTRSADAYLKALRFSTNDREKATLGFLLGDAYQKGNRLPKAIDAFKQVVTSYDSVWARLAQQRLTTLELAELVENS